MIVVFPAPDSAFSTSSTNGFDVCADGADPGAYLTMMKRMRTTYLLALGLSFGLNACVVHPVGAVAQALGSSPAQFAAVDRQVNVMVPARDGVLLATDIYRPEKDGKPVEEKLPVLLHRTPYDKSAAATVTIAEYLAKHGYVVMVQDTRGRHHSQGVFEKYYDFDAYDGYDTIEWSARQPYSDGKVGMFGTSYAAHTQADASKLNPPHLTTMVINMGGMSSAWNHSVRYDGAFEMGRQLTWAWGQALEDTKDPVVKAMLSKESVTDWYAALPLRKGQSPLAIVPKYEGYYLEEATNSDYGKYWDSLGMQWEKYYAQTADVPMMHIGGWYDIYLRGTIENYQKLSTLKKAPERMVIGPWTHHGDMRDYAGDVDFGPDAAIKDFDGDFHLRWFDYYLKGIQTSTAKEAGVRYFLMGGGDGHKDAKGRLYHGGVWKDAQAWPPVEAKATRYYLHGDGTLTATAPGLKEAGKTTYQYDPGHPVPSIGGGVSARLKDGAYDQRERADMPGSRAPFLPLKSRQDVLVFETEPLAEDVTIAGPVEVTLYASSTGVDTDFTAKLVDVYPASEAFPEGFDMNLTDGILRASYRDEAKTRRLLTPGEVYKLTIRPFDTANVFQRGHRIRVDISSSNFPRFDVNPNTGEPLGASRRMIVVDNTIFHDPKHPSSIQLSLMPAGR
jgi:putative CocE/NonD family hydrolase